MGLVSVLKQIIMPTQRTVAPSRAAGVPGTAITNGYIVGNERNSKLVGSERYRTAADLLANISIVAAGTRYFLNLIAHPAWSIEPADDSPEAMEAAEFVESCMYDMTASWARIIRRSGLYRFHGFAIQEWVAKKRADGRIGYASIEPRPQFTIERWDMDDQFQVRGVIQRGPESGQEYYLPREKLIYLVDDTLTDSPEGMGLFRHLVEPSERLKRYLELEGMGYERDLRGIPIGRAPLTAINKAVANKELTEAEGNAMVQALRDFVKMQAKKRDTALVLDSQPYENTTADGLQVTGDQMWDVELLTGVSSGLEAMGLSINREIEEIARILGVESLLLGGASSGGNRALSEDKSRNLYLTANATLNDIAETMERDFVNPLWALNGFDDALKPTFKTEDVSFRSISEITAALRDMATAGAVLAPDDPAIDDVRDLLGISRQPEDPLARTVLQQPDEAVPGEGDVPEELPTAEDQAALDGKIKNKSRGSRRRGRGKRASVI